jgi:hypothetical protein
MPAPLSADRAGRTRRKLGGSKLRRRLLDRIAQAEFIGWPALAESWRRDLARFDARGADNRGQAQP